MSCDIIFNVRKGVVVASAGAWVVESCDEQTISITYLSSGPTSGACSTTIELPMAAFLNYKNFCEQTHLDIDLTKSNIPNIIANHSHRPSSMSHAHNYGALAQK